MFTISQHGAEAEAERHPSPANLPMLGKAWESLGESSLAGAHGHLEMSPPAPSHPPGTAPRRLSWECAKDLAFMGKHSFTCPPNPSLLLPSQPSQLSYVNQVGDTR